MGKLTVLKGGVLVSAWLARYTDKRPKTTQSYHQRIGGVTVPVTRGVLLRVNETDRDSMYVEAGQKVHFFQDPHDESIDRGTIVFAVFDGKSVVAVYRKGVGINQKHHKS